MDIREKLRVASSSEEKLNLLMAYNFPTTLTEKNGLFVLKCLSLGIVESDNSLSSAYDKLKNRKEKIFKDLIEIDEELDLPFDSSFGGSVNASNVQVSAGTGKYTIIRDAVVLVFVITLSIAIATAAKKAGKKLNKKIGKALNPPIEKVEKYKKRFRSGVQKIKPYIVIFNEEMSKKEVKN